MTTKPKKRRLSAVSEEPPEIPEEKRREFLKGAALHSGEAGPSETHHPRQQATGGKKPRRYVQKGFSMLQAESDLIDDLVLAAAKQGELRGRSDIIRAGLKVLKDLDDARLAAILADVEKLK